jgi:4-aminobutyrate aminotransferase
VRGKGLMIGLELVDADGAPAPEAAVAVLEAARERGLLIGKGGLYGNVIRLAPPMTLTADEVEEALAALRGAIEEASA